MTSLNGTVAPVETLAEFTERMSKVEKVDEFQVGRAHQGWSRATFEFEKQWCFVDQIGYRTLPPNRGRPYTPAQMYYVASGPEPKDRWTHCHLLYTKERAEKLMKHYGALHYEEDPYPREEGVWFALVFGSFEDLMKMVYDIYTGKFTELWGENAKRYESCFGLDEDNKAVSELGEQTLAGLAETERDARKESA